MIASSWWLPRDQKCMCQRGWTSASTCFPGMLYSAVDSSNVVDDEFRAHTPSSPTCNRQHSLGRLWWRCGQTRRGRLLAAPRSGNLFRTKKTWTPRLSSDSPAKAADYAFQQLPGGWYVSHAHSLLKVLRFLYIILPLTYVWGGRDGWDMRWPLICDHI